VPERETTPGGFAAVAVRAGHWARRAVRALSALSHERRLAAFAAIGLFLALFLPWYQETAIVVGKSGNPQTPTATLTGWGAFSFVEAAVLVVAAGVLTLLFQRAEGHAFHVPGGDGGVIAGAGLWTCVLVIWRIFDKQGTSAHGQVATSSGIEWGIFVALGVAGFLAWTGFRIRSAHEPEPPLPGEPPPATPAPRTRPADDAPIPAASEQLTIPLHPGDEPRRAR
jgi:hypothetical protein